MHSTGSIYITMVFYRYLHLTLSQTLHLAKICCISQNWFLLVEFSYKFEIQVKF